MATAAPSIAIVANGLIQDYSLIRSLIQQYPYLVAVDGGLCHCSRMMLRPNLIVGDFDSSSLDMLKAFAGVPVRTFPVDKDLSDLELALSLVDRAEVQRITIFAALGGRTDHLLGNLHLLRRYPGKAVIESEFEQIFSIQGKTTLPCTQGQTVSLIPISGPVHGVTTHGLKWELSDATLDSAYISLSNVCVKTPVQVEIKSGDIICCLVKN